ncbi:MAG: TolC family protein [Gemmatimonadota bacterium]
MRSHGLAVLTALAVAAPVGAQETVPPGGSLGLGDVVQSTLRTHPAVGGAWARREAAEAAVGEARAALYPTIGLSVEGAWHQEPMVVAPLHGFDAMDPPDFDEALYQGHAGAQYTLFDGGARSGRIRAAEAGAEAAAAGVVAARDAVLAEAVSAYLSVLSGIELLEARASQVDALEAELDRSRLMLDQGTTARVEVLRAQAVLSRARAERTAGAEGLELRRRRLARVSGLDLARVRSATLAPVGPAPAGTLSRDSLLREALAENAGLVATRRRLEAAEGRAEVARGARFPTLSASGRYSAFGSAATDPVLEWQAGLQVRYPLITGGARGRGIERADAEAADARAEAELAARSVADAVDAALLAYRAAAARVTALEDAVEQSAEVARIEALALEAGAGTQTDYLLAEASLLETRAALAEARQSLAEGWVGIARVTGRLTPEWLARLTGGADG